MVYCRLYNVDNCWNVIALFFSSSISGFLDSDSYLKKKEDYMQVTRIIWGYLKTATFIMFQEMVNGKIKIRAFFFLRRYFSFLI
jgi:hypothetical protein